MTLYLRRRAGFSAGFQRRPPGEKGRGHDYLCELTVGGEIDPSTGMVINIKDVDAVLKAQVVGPFHGRLLDVEVAAFQEAPPTPENLVRVIWDRCRNALPPESTLARVTLWPTTALEAKLSAIHASEKMRRIFPRSPLAPNSGGTEEDYPAYSGSPEWGRGGNPASSFTHSEKSPMLTVTRTYDFSASHRLHSPTISDAENAEIFGKCNWENGHGHNYDVEVTLAGDPDPRTGLLWDLDRLDQVVEAEVLTPYDHKHLNYDTSDFRALNPTSENLTKVVWNNLARRLGQEDLGGARLYKVAVRETARNYFEYYGE